MPRIVTMPDGTVHNFPDEATPEMMEEALGLRSVQPVAEQPQEPSLMDQLNRQAGLAGRYTIEGLSQIPNMVGDAANSVINSATGGINKLTGANIPALRMPSETTSNLLAQANFPEPETPLERVIGDVSRSIVGVGGPAKLADQVAKYAGKYAPAIAKIGDDLATQIKAATGASAAAGATREAGGGTAAQVAAGLGGGLAGGKVGMPAKTNRQTSEQLRKQAKGLYESATEKGGVLKPQFVDEFAKRAEGLKPYRPAGGIMGESLDDLAKKMDPDQVRILDISDSIQNLRGKHMTLAEAQRLDEMMTESLNGFLHPKTGKLTKAGMKLSDLQDEFRDMLDSTTDDMIVGGKDGLQDWKAAKQSWRDAAKVRDIEAVLARAESMDNPAQGIKSGFRTLANNPKRMRGFTDRERKLIKSAANSGAPSDLLRIVGSRLLPIGSAAAGNIPAALGSVAVGGIARKAAEQLQVGKANKIIDEILRQTPAKQPLVTPATALGTAQGLESPLSRRRKRPI